MPTMCQSHLISHSFPIPVSRSLQVSLLASQPAESAAGGEPCGEPAISHDSHHVSLVQWTNLFASRHKGHRFKSPGGYLCETGILLLALSRYRTNNIDAAEGTMKNKRRVDTYLRHFPCCYRTRLVIICCADRKRNIFNTRQGQLKK